MKAMLFPGSRLAVVAIVPLVVAAGSSVSAPADEYIEKTDVIVDPRRESPPERRTTVVHVPCRAGYTAVAGRVVRHTAEVVVVASHAVPPSWLFELTNYHEFYSHAFVEVTCVRGGTPPPRYFLHLRSFVLQPKETRRPAVEGPRYVSPLGFSFRMRPLQGSEPPPGDSRVQILTAQPQKRGYAFRIENTGSEPVRVEAGAVFVRTRSSRTVAPTRVVSVGRSVPPGQWVYANARCRPGSAAVASGWSFPGREISSLATHAGRDFRFGAFNGSDAVRRVRFFGICLKGQPVPARAPFNLGPNAVSAEGTFTNGQGGCPVATSFRDRFAFLARGDGMLTITQPRTGDQVLGPVLPDGSFHLRSARESYDGKITGNKATASYSYTTAAGCTETYEVTFDVNRAP